MASSTTSNTPPVQRSGLQLGRIWDNFGMLVVFALLFIVCAIFVPNFGTFINMKGLGLAMSMSGMVACGMLFCLASGDFDLSIASVIACAGVVTPGWAWPPGGCLGVQPGLFTDSLSPG